MTTSTKVLKKDIGAYVKNQLLTNPAWATKALLKIFDFQTYEEKQYETTNVDNGVGFTGADAEILSSFAKQYKSRGFLSSKQMYILHKRIPKYWSQIIRISDEEKLKTMVAKNLVSKTI
jgi:hypothetical protein